jgi:hydrogenase maturation factor HypE
MPKKGLKRIILAAACRSGCQQFALIAMVHFADQASVFHLFQNAGGATIAYAQMALNQRSRGLALF